MQDTAGGGARAEQITFLPPGDAWLGAALRCARDPAQCGAHEAQLANALPPDLARKCDAFRLGAAEALAGRRAPREGSDLVVALGTVFAAWLPEGAADPRALDPFLQRMDRLRAPSLRAPAPPARGQRQGPGPRATAPPAPPRVDAAGIVLTILENAPGKRLGLDALRASFKRAAGFDLSTQALRQHAGYRGGKKLADFLKTVPDLERPDPNSVSIKQRDRSSAFEDVEPVGREPVALKPVFVADDWENDDDAETRPLGNGEPKKGGGSSSRGGRRRGGGGANRGNWRAAKKG